MALATLGIIFIVMAAITILSIALLFIKEGGFVKSNIVFSIIGVWGIFVSYMAFSSLPTNYFLERVLTLGVGIIPIGAVLLRLAKPNKDKAAKLLMAAGLVLSSALLYF